MATQERKVITQNDCITQADIIYFCLTDRFNPTNPSEAPNKIKRYHNGTLQGILNKADYLIDLGITAVWITPVYLNIGDNGDSDSYHGYWALDFEQEDGHLNGSDLPASKAVFKQFVDDMHHKGLKVILDMVVNHTGYHNAAYRNQAEKKIKDHWFNHEGQGDTKGELAGLPDLNHDIPDVRDYFVNNIVDWIAETGINGIRMDTVKHVENSFWHSFKTYVRGRYPNIFLVGEVLSPDVNLVSKYQTKMDFDSLFDFPLRKTIVDTLVKEGPLTWLARPRYGDGESPGVLDIDTQYYTNANRLVTLLDNHDLDARIKSTILNHVGDWDRNLCLKILKNCLAFQFTTRGIPQLYYGTEIGLQGGADPWNRRDFRWELTAWSTYTPHPNDREAIEAKEIFDFTKKVISIRQSNEAIQFGYLFTLFVNQTVYAYMREFRGNTIIVVINNSREDMLNPLQLNIGSNSNIPSRIKENCAIGGRMTNLLDDSGQDIVHFSNGFLDVRLKGKETKIYKL